MKGYQVNIKFAGRPMEGYAEIVDYHVAKTGKDKFIVTAVVDIHMPEPVGGYRRNCSHEITGFTKRSELEEYVNGVIAKFNSGRGFEWQNSEYH